MTVIRFIEDDESIKVINPKHVIDVNVTKYDMKYNIKLTLTDGGSHTVIKYGKEEADKTLTYIINCLASIE